VEAEDEMNQVRHRNFRREASVRRPRARLDEMQTASGDFELTMDELRAVVGFAVACAEPSLVLFERACPEDPRPAAALEVAQAFSEGAARSRLQRVAGADAHRAAKDAPNPAARHAAYAAGDAAAAAYLHPLAKATQVRHLLGAAAHAARAAEVARGDDPVVAEYVITAAAKRAGPIVHDVLSRYPRAAGGHGRVAVLIQRLDAMLRDPAPTPRVVDDPGPFYHGTKAGLRPGDLLTPGWRSNYGSRRMANHIYVTATRDGAPLAAALANGEGRGRVYRVEPLGTIEDDPNVTDKRFPGNPTRSYRTTEPVRVVEEIFDWQPPPQQLIQRMREGMAELAELGIEAMDD
jgi:rifampin ADP-ribosylating transferase